MNSSIKNINVRKEKPAEDNPTLEASFSYSPNPGFGQSNRMDRTYAESYPVSYAGKGPKGYKRSDERLKEEIFEIFKFHADLDAADIQIEVKEGEVFLTGMVPDKNMKFLAEDLADGVYGVSEVQNQLRVKKGWI